MDSKKSEDNSLGVTLYQGKTLSQWEKEFNGEFNVKQLFQLIRSGVDLGRVKLGLVDEDEGICNDPLFKDEEFFFEKDNMIETSDEEAALDESAAREPEDVVTVGDFIELLRIKTSLDDKIVFRSTDKKECMILNVESKAGVALVDLIERKTAERLDEDERYTGKYEQWKEMTDWFKANGYPLEDDDKRIYTIEGDQVLFKKGCSPTGIDKAFRGIDAWNIYKSLSTQKLNEDVEAEGGINDDFMTVSDLKRISKDAYPNNKDAWMLDSIAGIVNGKTVDFTKIMYVRPERYPTNGTFFLLDGSQASLDEFNHQKGIMLSEKESTSEECKEDSKAVLEKDNSWHSVEEIDPKASGKMQGWRCGPAPQPFVDALYPNRKYKEGAMMLRNKYVQAGANSGIVEIGVASIFDAVKNNDGQAIKLLNLLKIPLDLTFGLDCEDDFSSTYTNC